MLFQSERSMDRDSGDGDASQYWGGRAETRLYQNAEVFVSQIHGDEVDRSKDSVPKSSMTIEAWM